MKLVVVQVLALAQRERHTSPSTSLGLRINHSSHRTQHTFINSWAKPGFSSWFCGLSTLPTSPVAGVTASAIFSFPSRCISASRVVLLVIAAAAQQRRIAQQVPPHFSVCQRVNASRTPEKPVSRKVIWATHSGRSREEVDSAAHQGYACLR